MEYQRKNTKIVNKIFPWVNISCSNFVSFVSKDLVDPINLQPQGRSLRWRARHQAAIPTASRCQFIDVLHTDRAFIDWGHPIFTEGRHQPFGIPAKAQELLAWDPASHSCLPEKVERKEKSCHLNIKSKVNSSNLGCFL